MVETAKKPSPLHQYPYSVEVGFLPPKDIAGLLHAVEHVAHPLQPAASRLTLLDLLLDTVELPGEVLRGHPQGVEVRELNGRLLCGSLPAAAPRALVLSDDQRAESAAHGREDRDDELDPDRVAALRHGGPLPATRAGTSTARTILPQDTASKGTAMWVVGLTTAACQRMRARAAPQGACGAATTSRAARFPCPGSHHPASRGPRAPTEPRSTYC